MATSFHEKVLLFLAHVGLAAGSLSCTSGDKAGAGKSEAESLASTSSEKQPAAPSPAKATRCDGSSIAVDRPVALADVPNGGSTPCDFHTFAWNQFAWLIADDGGKPRFAGMAPWKNLFVAPGTKPTAYPGGSTALDPTELDKARNQEQAGDSFKLIDTNGQVVDYYMRVNKDLYDAIRDGALYDQATYDTKCDPDAAAQGDCKNQVWLPPVDVDDKRWSMEIKTAWRNFDPAKGLRCPKASMYCDGQYGLVGMHVVQKTVTHGEWIWASFEHDSNAPDCAPGHSNPIAPKAPDGLDWGLFSPSTAPAGVMTDKSCDITSSSPQCNGDPCSKRDGSGACVAFARVNVCRSDALPAGGASEANCAIDGDGDRNKPNVACLNATLQGRLDGVWKHYILIGSVWTDPGAKPNQLFNIAGFTDADADRMPDYLVPKGFPNLANTSMETWMQKDSSGFAPTGFQQNKAKPLVKGNTNQPGCFNCHQFPSYGAPATYEASMDMSHLFRRIQPRASGSQ